MLTVATLNVHGRGARWRSRRVALAAQLAALNPDVIALQELRTWPSQGRWLVAAVNRLVAPPAFMFSGARKAGWRGYEGIGIISRLPVRERNIVRLGHGGRIALRCRLESGGDALDFYAVHLHHGGVAGETRLAAARILMDHVGAQPHVPAVIAGDLNAQPSSRTLKLLSTHFRSAYAAVHGAEPERTVPTNLAVRPLVLDYILASPSLEVTSAALAFTTRDAAGETVSDHFGLVATIEFASITT